MSNKARKKAEDKLLLTLACGATVEAAARECRLSPRTVYRRLADAAFRQRLREAVADLVQRASRMLTAANGEAARTLLALLKETTPPATRHAAARSIIELGIKVRETADLEQRLADLEARVAQSERPS
jgi:hypothetical protein